MPELGGLSVGRYVRLTDDVPDGQGRYWRVLGSAAYTQPGLEPSAPTEITTIDGQGAGLVSWNPPEFGVPLLAYRVQWAAVSGLGVVGSPLGTSTDLSSSAGDYAMTLPVGLYAARVSARNAAGWGDWSGWVSFESEAGEVVESAPGAPTGLAVTRQADGTYRAIFTAPGSVNPPLTGYTYRVDAGTPVALPATATSFTLTPTPGAGERVLTLAAVNPVGAGAAATLGFLVTATPAPQPPRDVAVTPAFNGGTVTWVASLSAGVVRYELSVDDGRQRASVLASEPLRKAFVGLLPGSHQVAVEALGADGQRSAPVVVSWFITSDTSAVIEYRVLTGSDNRAGFAEAQRNAIGQGKPLRVVGGLGRVDGTAYWLDALTDLRFDAGSGFKVFGDPHGGLARIGSGPAATTIAVTGGGAQFSNTLTLADASSVNVGDWFYYDFDLKYSHKDTWGGQLCRVTGKSGNVVEFADYFHRGRDGKAGRVRKIGLARPAVAQGGIVEHSDMVNAKGHDLVVMLGCRETVWDGLEIRNGPGTGLKTAFGYRNQYTSLHSHHLRNNPGAFQYGYAVSDEGDFETYYDLESSYVRHAFTTDQTNQLGSHGSWGDLAGKGECVRARVHMNVYDTTCTGFNDHEPGWEIEYTGVVRNTGTVAKGVSATNGVAGATNTNDPSGGFIRSRKARIGPAGLVLRDINSHGAKKWYSAFTIADLADKMKPLGFTAWDIADAPTLGPGKLTIGTQGQADINCTDALAVQQPVKLGNVDIYGPVDIGIDLDVAYGSSQNSQVTGTVRIERAGLGVSDSALLTGAAGITFVNCTKNLG